MWLYPTTIDPGSHLLQYYDFPSPFKQRSFPNNRSKPSILKYLYRPSKVARYVYTIDLVAELPAVAWVALLERNHQRSKPPNSNPRVVAFFFIEGAELVIVVHPFLPDSPNQ